VQGSASRVALACRFMYPRQTKNPRALHFSRVFHTFIESNRINAIDGAGDRTRTGKPVKAADFRHTASFKAGVACANRSCAGLCLHRRARA
ncbi:hypothetical protein, partial [Burkholderia sp. KCJ3K979]|uniref:hypothetical protein n=1 Tax=Burkholderia sp. KCJ3K979 TaxID=2759149 RepID=UPI001F272D90